MSGVEDIAAPEIVAIESKSALGAVNSYLVKAGPGFILVDTGFKMKRAQFDKALEGAGCRPGDLKLIVITHGDFDHIGNAAHLRGIYGAPIAMHEGDAGMAERGDMFWNRKSANVLFKAVAGVLLFLLQMKPERFTPDILLGDGDDLSSYGLNARVIHLPGHSSGSIGILTASGDLFCGDLLENIKGPRPGSIVDDRASLMDSLQKVKNSRAKTIYPGHGKPFPLSQLVL